MFSDDRRSPRPRRAGVRLAAAGGAVLAATAGCGNLASGTETELDDNINLTSTMMQAGEPMPNLYTCRGEGVSPALQWSGLPDEGVTESLALVVDAPEEATVFWVLFGLDPQTAELRQNTVPHPGEQGRNTEGETAYDPPCRSEDGADEVRFTLYALDSELDLAEDASLEEALGAIAARAVSRGSLTVSSGQ
ncbi:YbhB/YbcL family Raf kinase inhibitor-like protein [Streptomonospora wellingtoniae]|uniref:YbhB/YbcL family Raf kinase inhibitor-like protein n=1 Tax=Streptomonospora wellingtoniae TaxID=3075544 RepID=A0ABU2KUM6_9ACTN|nr:YbhB/YbcL family Raf kinase inhibitor-like protein [Streptomonospora sp. DSM 45055]MDT0302999.1 YbhB/YbcL family Raf kinase inhibitor-like protein [Streptomonospora sp. DSM 45055]